MRAYFVFEDVFAKQTPFKPWGRDSSACAAPPTSTDSRWFPRPGCGCVDVRTSRGGSPGVTWKPLLVLLLMPLLMLLLMLPELLLLELEMPPPRPRPRAPPSLWPAWRGPRSAPGRTPTSTGAVWAWAHAADEDYRGRRDETPRTSGCRERLLWAAGAARTETDDDGEAFRAGNCRRRPRREGCR